MTAPEHLEELIAELRVANENLVIASVRAQDLQDAAEASIHRQNEFLSMLAHELRNPLAPISMAADLLERVSAGDPQLTHIHHVIARQVAHMKRLLEDLLDASRVATGKIKLIKMPLLLQEIIHSAAEIAKPSLQSRQQPLILELPMQPIVVNGDAVRLAQVFSNLLLNASKYTPHPLPITVSVQVRAGQVLVTVKDHGAGIELDLQEFIFDLFTQSPRTLDRAEGGLGIGLAMVRALVTMHGGSVSVNSQGEGMGSEFTVVLPLSCEELPHAPVFNAPQPASQGCRILIIEDNVDGNHVLNLCLTAEGNFVDSAFTGTEGLAKAIEGRYEIIFCDIGLPGMDGYQLVRQLRQRGLDPEPYCVAMTGYDQASYRDRAKAAGFDEFVVKPVSVDRLLDIVAAVAGRSTASL